MAKSTCGVQAPTSFPATRMPRQEGVLYSVTNFPAWQWVLKPWWVVWVALFIMACTVRFVGLGRYSFDLDEIFSLSAASADWPTLFVLAARDVSHPPLFYILLKVWLFIGPASESWVRLLPAIFGAASFIPLYKISRLARLRDGDTCVVLCLFAFNGVLIYYAQHARMYSLLQLLAVTSIYALLRYSAGQARYLSEFWFLTAVNFFLVYSHYWGWFVIVAELSALAILDRSKLFSFVKSTVLIALLFIPWALAVMAVIAQRGNATAQIAWMGKPSISNEFSQVIWLFGDLDGAPDFHGSTTIGLALFGVPILVMIYRSWITRGDRELYAVSPFCWILLVALPISLTLGIGHVVGQSVWGVRYLTIVAAPYFLLVGLASGRLPWRGIAQATQCALVLWSIAGGVQSLLEPNKKHQWRSLVDTIVAQSTAEQPLVIHTLEFECREPISFYLDHEGIRNVALTLDEDVTGLTGDQFWLVYIRHITWQDPLMPEHILQSRGFVIDHRASTSTKGQTIMAVHFHHAP